MPAAQRPQRLLNRPLFHPLWCGVAPAGAAPDHVPDLRADPWSNPAPGHRGRSALLLALGGAHDRRMGLARKVAIAAAVAGVYGCWVRPRLLYWGATQADLDAPFPGAEIVPDGKRGGTMATTIDAPPEQVWPWLVQLGWDRGGWYSWDRLDNAGRPSAREIHPEWQDLTVGDQLKYWVLGHVADSYRVALLEPNRFLGLYGCTDLRGRWLEQDQPRPTAYTEGLWGFLLNPLPHGRTRLVISGYQTFRPRWVERYLIPWSFILLVWPMQARMMSVLKRNIEAANRTGTTIPYPGTAPQTTTPAAG